ncbi:DEAD/DEAH box helicase [Delftia tsuruhatensis]|uniref:DNA 3'-5' helicase II n=1 Tax=Delftia tsuruhatensis TaxID=180282 RepID=A0AAX3SGX0_9BURK|nr:ATP-binding domain-containing protein [Delftia tsuruhatensis]WFF79306.1 AAA family ATPase [Delftia tsuruhatensis]
MSNSFFFCQAEKNHSNQDFIEKIERYAVENKEQIYLISKPLGDSRYSYEYESALVVLSPKRKITFIDFGEGGPDFTDFIEDFIEDLSSVSDKYRYKDAIGRPRSWRKSLVTEVESEEPDQFDSWSSESHLTDPAKQRIAELLVSLLTGSINDIEKVQATLPASLLDKVKRKILLFDGDQTRFIYEKPKSDIIRIQGLSGTGKTELLLHKLRDLYVNHSESKIIFTCHNKILAEHLRRRIPDFFNFMKVEEQIAWNQRLWCFHGWGSGADVNSGAYRLICSKYKLQFRPYSSVMTFDRACQEALVQIPNDAPAYFDYILIDESQDFPESFIELCRRATKESIYVAGDIFQSIFDANIAPNISPDHLLSKCYRTDPRTLMFAHAIGMGLFEEEKLRWLEDEEWAACGYKVEKKLSGSLYRLTRDPLRRFEDIDEGIPSVILEEVEGKFISAASTSIVNAIRDLASENPTLQPEDIGVIILDKNNNAFSLADNLAVRIPRELNWPVNKAHETKQKIPGQVFVSNKNNVKGLEFPFVICVSETINRGYVYRNSLYMTLTRSFLQSRMIVSATNNKEILNQISIGLNQINQRGVIEVRQPSEEEKAKIKTTIRIAGTAMSFFDMADRAFNELEILPIFRESLLVALKKIIGEEPDYENIKETSLYMYEKMLRSQV